MIETLAFHGFSSIDSIYWLSMRPASEEDPDLARPNLPKLAPRGQSPRTNKTGAVQRLIMNNHTLEVWARYLGEHPRNWQNSHKLLYLGVSCLPHAFLKVSVYLSLSLSLSLCGQPAQDLACNVWGLHGITCKHANAIYIAIPCNAST